MKVKVNFFPPISQKLGKEEELLELSKEKVTVLEVLQQLEKRHGEGFKNIIFPTPSSPKINSKISLMKNGVLVGPEDIVDDGDTIIILMLVGGG